MTQKRKKATGCVCPWRSCVPLCADRRGSTVRCPNLAIRGAVRGHPGLSGLPGSWRSADSELSTTGKCQRPAAQTTPSCRRPLSPIQQQILRSLRGTGRYVGKGAFFKGKRIEEFPLRSRLALRKRGLIEYFAAGQWFLTEDGRDRLCGLNAETADRKPPGAE